MNRRLIPAALAAVLVLGACGSATEEVSVVSIVPLNETSGTTAGDSDGGDETAAQPSDDAGGADAVADATDSGGSDGTGTAGGDEATSDTELIPAGGGVGESRLVRAAQIAADAVVSFRFEARITMDGMPGLGTIDMPFVGEFDHDNNRMGMEMDLTSMLSQIADDGAQMMPGTMRMIMDGDIAYMNMGELEAVFGAGPDGWIRIDSNAGGGTGSMMSGTSDPRAFLALLAGDDGSVPEVGREDIRGVATTHYRGTLDMAAAMATASAEQQADLSSALSAQGLSLETLGDLVIPVDVWIDDNDQVRRFSLTMDIGDMAGSMGQAEGVSGVTMVMNMEMFDYGAEIDVALPPPDMVVDLTESMTAGS